MFNKKKLSWLPFVLGAIGALTSSLLSLSVSISVITSLMFWISGVFLSYEDLKKKSPQSDDMTFEEYIDYSKEAVKHLKNKARTIEDEKVASKILDISSNIQKINDALVAAPEKFTKNRKVFSYYIPSTVKLIDKYDEIEDQKLTSKNSRDYMKSVAELVDTLDIAYKNILNNVYEFDILDSSADVNVLSDLLKLEGLNNE